MKKGRACCNYLAAFCLPLIIVLFTAIVAGIYPFGRNTSLIWDAVSEYLSYFAYLQSLLQGRSSEWFYSLSIAMGNGSAGLIGTYLMSFYNILVLFFNKSQLPIAIEIIQLLKLSSCGLTMYIYISGG